MRPVSGLLAGALVGLAVGVAVALGGAAVAWPSVVLLDGTSRLFLSLVNLLFFGLSAHLWARPADEPGTVITWRFAALALGFLIACDLAVLAPNVLASWIALEVSTLCAAPLVARAGVPAANRASFQYLVFSTVGLGLVLLGYTCLSYSQRDGGHAGSLALAALATHAHPSDPWATLGLILVLVGFGTKLGLAPMYVWLPDTYEHAPPSVVALLASVQFNATLVGLLRVCQVFRPGNEALVDLVLVGLGVTSVGVATASLVATRSLRRLVAYASIAHGGIVAIGLGSGGAGYGVVLYAVSNAFVKAILFVTAGRIEAHYGTSDTTRIRGVLKAMPSGGVVLMVATFALLGFPPFGSFLGELLILSGLVKTGHALVFAAVGALVTAMFVATGRTVFPMIWGEAEHPVQVAPLRWSSAAPMWVFLGALVVLGIHLPAPVNALFREVAVSLGDE